MKGILRLDVDDVLGVIQRELLVAVAEYEHFLSCRRDEGVLPCRRGTPHLCCRSARTARGGTNGRADSGRRRCPWR